MIFSLGKFAANLLLDAFCVIISFALHANMYIEVYVYECVRTHRNNPSWLPLSICTWQEHRQHFRALDTLSEVKVLIIFQYVIFYSSNIWQ